MGSRSRVFALKEFTLQGERAKCVGRKSLLCAAVSTRGCGSIGVGLRRYRCGPASILALAYGDTAIVKRVENGRLRAYSIVLREKQLF